MNTVSSFRFSSGSRPPGFAALAVASPRSDDFGGRSASSAVDATSIGRAAEHRRRGCRRRRGDTAERRSRNGRCAPSRWRRGGSDTRCRTIGAGWLSIGYTPQEGSLDRMAMRPIDCALEADGPPGAGMDDAIQRFLLGAFREWIQRSAHGALRSRIDRAPHRTWRCRVCSPGCPRRSVTSGKGFDIQPAKGDP